MSERDPLGARLDSLVPPFDGDADAWDDVVRRVRAGHPPAPAPPRARRRRRVAAAALATLVAACVTVLADPFGGEQRGVLERALAAVGDGPVLHVVTRTEIGGTLLELDSGRRIQIRAEREVFFDPERGIRTTFRLRDTVLSDFGEPARPARRSPGLVRQDSRGAVEVFTRDYRASLRSGRARVVRKGELYGIPVYWIRVEAGPRVPRRASCRRLICQEVAVSRETYKPLYVRPSGRAPSGLGERILKIESLPAGAGEIPGTVRSPSRSFVPLKRRPVDPAGARRLLGGRLAWLGRRIAGLELARMNAGGSRPYRYSGRMRRPRFGPRGDVIHLLFGERRDITSGRAPRFWKRLLVVNQARRPTTPGLLHWGGPSGPVGYAPPEGSVLLTARGRQAVLRDNGLVVGVFGSSPELVLIAVRALRR